MGKSQLLSDHINYQPPVPQVGETPIAFALRWAAHLVSPPQVPGESHEVECVDVARQIRDLTPEVETAWEGRNTAL